jgi:hypothetical protein
MTRKLLAPLALFLGLVACDADPLANDDDDEEPFTRETIQLDVQGLGQVNDRITAEVAVAGDIAYTTTWGSKGGVRGNAVKIWNVAGDNPVLVDSLIVQDAATLGDVQISDDGGILVVAIEHNPVGSLAIYDRQNPTKPTLLARYQTPNTTRGVHTVKLSRIGGTLYAFLNVNPTPAHVVIVSLADPANPVEVKVLPLGRPYIHDVFVRDGYLFTAEWDDGISIWDIGGAGRGGSPADPVLISNVQTRGGNAHNIWWFHNPNGEKKYVFVGEEQGGAYGSASLGDIHVVDISDIDQPEEVAFYHLETGGAHNFVMDEENGILYAAFYEAGVRALDVRGDLGACTSAEREPVTQRCDLTLMRRVAGSALSTVQPLSVWGVARNGAALYASDMFAGLYKLDIAPLR